jgi:excinuclease ABC subunit A
MIEQSIDREAAQPDENAAPRVVLTASDAIVIRGARTHNLKSIDVDIPHNALTVVTGVSGSGKSSLAFDTIYAEGQRRYVESLSAYARQFLERIEKPDVDFMDGLAPAIAIKQKNSTRNPRSTVATATEIYDYLRLLYARCGTVTCLHCGGIVRHDTVDEIVAALLALPEGTRAYALFPITRAEIKFEPLQPSTTEAASEPPKPSKPVKKSTSKKSVKSVPSVLSFSLTDTLKDRLAELRRRGYNRLYQPSALDPGQPGNGVASQGKIVEFSTPESLLELDFDQPIFVLIDRLAIGPDIRARIVDAIETGYRESGEVQFHTVPREENEASTHLRFSAAFECSTCHRAYREPEPRLFSFNNPYGACPRCQGFGNTVDFDPNLILPDRSRTLAQGAIAPWTTPKYRPFHGEMIRFAKSAAIPTDVPWYDLDPPQQDLLWNGSGPYPGIRGFFAALERKKYKLHVRVFLSKYRGYALCPDCHGQRLRAEARAVLIDNKNICEVSALTITAAEAFFDNLQLTPLQTEIAGKILEEVRQRIHFLIEVGLDYLTLDRLSSTLSGGESQRIQLATSLGSRLVGALYVLDEPSIGLHPRDTAKLIRILHALRDLGNTILVVEHDPSVIRSADHLLDLGPGAGELGGHVLAAGTVAEVTANPQSITGKYLSGRLTIPIPKHRREPGRELLQLTGVRLHNLRGIDVEIPLNLLCCVTGVSGSGKSTLIHQVLYRALMQQLHREPGSSAPEPTNLYRELTGSQYLNDVVLVDQSPIGRTPRSNPVTYIKAFDDIRALFAAQPDAKRHGFGPGAFSFNVPGGRCDTCEGDGTVTVEMQFLADIELPCEDCNGTRYKSSILEIKYKNKNIHDVLNLTVKQALSYFAGNPRIVDKLAVLDEVGLGYVRLGQSATTLSGGEAQRVKLASHLATARSIANRSGGSSSDLYNQSGNSTAAHTAAQIAARSRSRTLYILDEPTTGLHFDDVQKLLAAFRKLIDGGGSLLVIEHNLDIIKSADYVIDLGPEGGDAGGQVVATGTPEQIAANPASHTGTHLVGMLT